MTSAELEANLRNWDERAPLHAASPGYDLDRLVRDPRALSHVVRTDAKLMAPHLPGGSVAGLRLVHLQCHIGTDSVSLARLGAHVTGIDLSNAAIAVATDLADRAGVADRARFVCATVDDAPAALDGERFDVVYTSVGVLCWLPDLTAWGRTIAALLKPGGLFHLRDDHPMRGALVWDEGAGKLVVAYPYFAAEPNVWDDEESYVPTHAPLTNTPTYEWSHSLSEVIGPLLAAGLTLEAFDEHRRADWSPFPPVVAVGDDYVLAEHPERVPLTFSLAARAPVANG